MTRIRSIAVAALPDIALAVLVASISAGLGLAAGLVWSATAGSVSLHGELVADPSAYRGLLGQDLLLAAIGIVAGLLTVAVLMAVARVAGPLTRRLIRGPGATLGLAVGGAIGGQVAAHFGQSHRQAAFLTRVHAMVPQLPHFYFPALDFRMRLGGLLLLWPLVAVVVHVIVVSRTPRPDPAQLPGR